MHFNGVEHQLSKLDEIISENEDDTYAELFDRTKHFCGYCSHTRPQFACVTDLLTAPKAQLECLLSRYPNTIAAEVLKSKVT